MNLACKDSKYYGGEERERKSSRAMRKTIFQFLY